MPTVEFTNGMYIVTTASGQRYENLSRNEAELIVRGDGVEDIGPLFDAAAKGDISKSPLDISPNSAANSVFVQSAKKNTGIAAGALKRENDDDFYKQVKDDQINIYEGMGLKKSHAKKRAKGDVAIQKAADRVARSVYFMPDEESQYKQQKRGLKDNGYRPVLLTKEDMVLLRSKEFVLRNADGKPVDKDGNIIKPDDPDAAERYVTAFTKDENGKEILDMEMVKIISSQKVGLDNELELEERVGLTKEWTANTEGARKVHVNETTGITDHYSSRQVANLLEHLGYDIKNDLTEAKMVGIAGLYTAKGILEYKLGEKYLFKQEEGYGPGENVTAYVPDGQGQDTINVHYSGEGDGTFTYQTTIPGAEHNNSTTIVGPGGVITNDEVWHDPDVVEDHEQDYHYTYEGDTTATYYYDQYKPEDFTLQGEKQLFGKFNKKLFGIGVAGINALEAAHKIANTNDLKKANDDIMSKMDLEAFVSDASDFTAFKGIKGKDNQKILAKVIEEAKAKGLTKEQMEDLIQTARGNTNDVLAEKELTALLKLVKDYEPLPKETDCPPCDDDDETVEKLDDDSDNDVDIDDEGGKDLRYSTAYVKSQKEDDITVKNQVYKMKKGDRIRQVVKAKYGITDKADLDAAVIAVRRATGLPDDGYAADGKNAAIPEIEGLKDAYYLPEQILGGKYKLAMDKDGARWAYEEYSPTSMVGRNVETVIVRNGTKYEVRVKETDKLITTCDTEEAANIAKQQYDDEKHVIEETEDK